MQILVTLLTIALAGVIGAIAIAIQQRRRETRERAIQASYGNFIDIDNFLPNPLPPSVFFSTREFIWSEASRFPGSEGHLVKVPVSPDDKARLEKERLDEMTVRLSGAFRESLNKKQETLKEDEETKDKPHTS